MPNKEEKTKWRVKKRSTEWGIKGLKQKVEYDKYNQKTFEKKSILGRKKEQRFDRVDAAGRRILTEDVKDGFREKRTRHFYEDGRSRVSYESNVDNYRLVVDIDPRGRQFIRELREGSRHETLSDPDQHGKRVRKIVDKEYLRVDEINADGTSTLRRLRDGDRTETLSEPDEAGNRTRVIRDGTRYFKRESVGKNGKVTLVEERKNGIFRQRVTKQQKDGSYEVEKTGINRYGARYRTVETLTETKPVPSMEPDGQATRRVRRLGSDKELPSLPVSERSGPDRLEDGGRPSGTEANQAYLSDNSMPPARSAAGRNMSTSALNGDKSPLASSVARDSGLGTTSLRDSYEDHIAQAGRSPAASLGNRSVVTNDAALEPRSRFSVSTIGSSRSSVLSSVSNASSISTATGETSGPRKAALAALEGRGPAAARTIPVAVAGADFTHSKVTSINRSQDQTPGRPIYVDRSLKPSVMSSVAPQRRPSLELVLNAAPGQTKRLQAIVSSHRNGTGVEKAPEVALEDRVVPSSRDLQEPETLRAVAYQPLPVAKIKRLQSGHTRQVSEPATLGSIAGGNHETIIVGMKASDAPSVSAASQGSSHTRSSSMASRGYEERPDRSGRSSGRE